MWKLKLHRILFIFWVSILATSCYQDKSEVVVGINQPIHYDDFDYIVTHVQRTSTIGNLENAIPAKGNFYIITFKVVNNAVSVSHEWDNNIAYIKDEDGNTYENNTQLQQVVNQINNFGWHKQYTTKFKKSQTIKLVFELPLTVKKPYLLVRGKSLLQDVFDGNKFKRTKVKLFD